MRTSAAAGEWDCMRVHDNTRAARYKAAMHAGVICIHSEQQCMQHDSPDLTMQTLSKKCAATQMITVRNARAAYSHH